MLQTLLAGVIALNPTALTVGQYDHWPPLELTVPERIEQAAQTYGVDPKLMIAIAQAENREFNPTAKNASSTASGIYQYLDGTFKNFCVEKYHLAESLKEKNDPDIQIECAVQMVSEGFISHWNESKSNWLKILKKK